MLECLEELFRMEIQKYIEENRLEGTGLQCITPQVKKINQTITLKDMSDRL